MLIVFGVESMRVCVAKRGTRPFYNRITVEGTGMGISPARIEIKAGHCPGKSAFLSEWLLETHRGRAAYEPGRNAVARARRTTEKSSRHGFCQILFSHRGPPADQIQGLYVWAQIRSLTGGHTFPRAAPVTAQTGSHIALVRRTLVADVRHDGPSASGAGRPPP